MVEIAEIEAMLIADVKEAVLAWKQADTKVKTPEQVAAIEVLKQQGYTVQDPKINQVAVDKQVAAMGAFKKHYASIQLRASGTKTPRPVEDRTFFANTLATNTEVAAFRDMKERLEGVPENVYELIDYDPEFIVGGVKTGQMTVSVISLGLVGKDGKLNGDQGKKVVLKYNNPGSLSNKIKQHRHINGKLEKAWAAEHATPAIITGS